MSAVPTVPQLEAAGPEAARVYAALQRPDAETLRRMLPDMADGLQAQLSELYLRPCADRCDRLAINLEGALLHVKRYREALVAEGEPSGQ